MPLEVDLPFFIVVSKIAVDPMTSNAVDVRPQLPVAPGRPPTGREAASAGAVTPLARFVANIEMRISQNERPQDVDRKRLRGRSGPQQAASAIPLHQVASVISSPLRRAILLDRPKRSISSLGKHEEASILAARPATPQEWIAENHEALIGNLSVHHQRAERPSVSPTQFDQLGLDTAIGSDGAFRPLLNDLAMRSIGARKATALARALAEAAPVAAILHQNHVRVKTNRLL